MLGLDSASVHTLLRRTRTPFGDTWKVGYDVNQKWEIGNIFSKESFCLGVSSRANIFGIFLFSEFLLNACFTFWINHPSLEERIPTIVTKN